jgi:hypothetical protein
MDKHFCERCGEKLNPETMIWLELDQDTGRYTDQPLQEGHTSQGGFTFGRACAKVVLADGGRNERIKKASRSRFSR